MWNFIKNIFKKKIVVIQPLPEKKYLVKFIIDGDLKKEYVWVTFAINEDMARYNFWYDHNEYYHDILDVKEIKNNEQL